MENVDMALMIREARKTRRVHHGFKPPQDLRDQQCYVHLPYGRHHDSDLGRLTIEIQEDVAPTLIFFSEKGKNRFYFYNFYFALLLCNLFRHLHKLTDFTSKIPYYILQSKFSLVDLDVLFLLISSFYFFTVLPLPRG